MARIDGIDADIFPLNLGTNSFGWTSDTAASHEVLDAFVANGGNFIDTADVYSAWGEGHTGGEAETVLGQWLASRKKRDDVVIGTKVGMWDKQPGLSPENVRSAVEGSLKRLQTDYVDLLYLHQPDPATDVEEQVLVFDEMVKSGKAKALGLSNFSAEQIHEWHETATRLGATIPVALQPQYSLVYRKEVESDLADPIATYSPAVFSYFSLASGFLTGKYRTQEDLERSTRRDFAAGYFSAEGLKVVDELDKVAAAHDVELATVALAWLRAKGVTAPVASVSRVEQLPALLASATLELSENEVEALDEVSQPFA